MICIYRERERERERERDYRPRKVLQFQSEIWSSRSLPLWGAPQKLHQSGGILLSQSLWRIQ